MDLFVKLLVGLLVLQSISVACSRLLLDNHRYVRSVDKDEAAVVGRTSDEVNDQQIEVHNAATEANSGESDQPQAKIADVMNVKDSDSSSSSSSSDESGSKSDENGGGCIGEGCNGGGGGGDDGSKSSEEGEGGGGCKGEGCNGGGGGGDDGSESSEEGEGGGGCKGKACNGGGGGGDDGSKSSEESEGSSEESGEGGGGAGTCPGKGCGWPARNCSIFPKMTKCMESEMDRMFDVTTLYFLVDENTRTPLDYGLDLIETFVAFDPSPGSIMLRDIIPPTRSIVRVIFGALNKFKAIVGQTIEYLVAEGVIPAPLVNLLQIACPGVIFGVEHGNPGLGCKKCLSPTDSSCSIADFSKFWKITALRSYLRYGLRVGLWIGVSEEDIETIRNIVVNFLKDEFGDEFNCPLKLTPCTGVIAKWLKSTYFMKDARLFSMYTRKLLKWTKLNSSDLGTIEDILQSFVDSLKDAHVKWDEIFPILFDMFNNFKDYVCDLIEKMLKGKTPV